MFADGGIDTYATAINNAGVVTGYGDHQSPGFTAFRGSAGTLTNLGTLGCSSYGRAINAGDTVAGSYGCNVSRRSTSNPDSWPTIVGCSPRSTGGREASERLRPATKEQRSISSAEIDQVLAEPETTYASESHSDRMVVLGKTASGRKLKEVVLTVDPD